MILGFWEQKFPNQKKHLMSVYKNRNSATNEWWVESLCGAMSYPLKDPQRPAQMTQKCLHCEKSNKLLSEILGNK